MTDRSASGGTVEEDGTGLPGGVISPNQVVSWNVRYYRKAAGMKQAELGEQLGWSFRAVSVAERTWARADGKGRVFDAEALVAISQALGIPVLALLLPPPGDYTVTAYGRQITPAELFTRLLPDSLTDSPAMAAYREALAAAAQGYLDPATDFGLIAYLRDMTDQGTRTGQAARLVDDLRAFEREYRKRLVAYFEGQIAELRAGAEEDP